MLLDDIATHLAFKGIAWPIFKSLLPPDPDAAIALFLTGSDQPPDGRSAVTYPTFQVHVRGAQFGFEDASAVMEQCFNALHSATDIANGDLSPPAGYVYCLGTSGPIALGLDDNERPALVYNFKIMAQA